MNNTDSLKIYELENSFQVVKLQLLETTQTTELLINKNDSLVNVIHDVGISQNYFGDILSSQLTLFSLIVGVLGLLIGLSVWGYFKWKFKLLEEKIDSNGVRDKIADENLKELINTKDKYLKVSINDLKQNLNDSIEENSTTLQELINIQKDEFQKEKVDILNKIYQTDIDVCRSMYFLCEKEKDYVGAFSWAFMILEHLIINKLEYLDKESWVDATGFMSERMKYTAWLEDGYENTKNKLELMSKESQDKKIKTKLEKISFTVGKLYFDNYNSEEDKTTTEFPPN